jgi:hypothetical protein
LTSDPAQATEAVPCVVRGLVDLALVAAKLAELDDATATKAATEIRAVHFTNDALEVRRRVMSGQ